MILCCRAHSYVVRFVSNFLAWPLRIEPPHGKTNKMLWRKQRRKLLVFSRTGSIAIKWKIHHQENMSVKYIPHIPHFYIVKPRYKGIYLVLLFLLKNIDCGYLLERNCGYSL